MKLFLPLSLMATTLLLEEVQAFATPQRSFVRSTALFDQPPDAKSAVETSGSTTPDLTSEDFRGSELDELVGFQKAAIDPNAPKLQEIAISQLRGAMAIYTFATVRDYVRSSIDEMEWYRPELILTQTAARDIDDTVARYLKIPVSLAAIFMFMSHPGNWENLKKCEELNTDENSPTNIRDSLGILQSKINCDIIEFDDQFHKKSLVYGITLNRGSVIGGKDWFPTNMNAIYKTLEPTPELDAAQLTEDIKVHQGFNNYLTSTPRGDRTDLKIDQIANNIIDIYKDDQYKDYSLFISGHSLGGALTQLLAYNLGANGKLKGVLPAGAPITAVSYASPQVGNDGFNQAFEQLESKGILRHIRLSNAGDMVPVAPFGFGYTQTGLHIFLKENEKEMQVGRRNLKPTMTQMRMPGDLGANHGLEEYLLRLLYKDNQSVLADSTIESLYSTYNVDDSKSK